MAQGPCFVLHAFGDLISGYDDAFHVLLRCSDGFVAGLPPPPPSLGSSTPAARVWEATLLALETHAPGKCLRVDAGSVTDIPFALCSAMAPRGPSRLLMASALDPLRKGIEAELARLGRADIAVELSPQQRLVPAQHSLPPAGHAGFTAFSQALAVPADPDHGCATALPVCVGLKCAAAAWGGLDLPAAFDSEGDSKTALRHALVVAAASAATAADPAEGPYLTSARQPPLLRVAVTAGLIHPAALWRAARAEAHACAEAIEHAASDPEGHSVRLTFCVSVLRWLTAREYCRALAAELRQCRGDSSGLLRPELASLPWAAGSSTAASGDRGMGQRGAPAAAASRKTDALEAAFLAGLTGYPLVDAAVRCLRATGSAPVPLCALLSNFYTKYLGLPFSRGAAALQHLRLDADGPCAHIQWQWDTGLSAGAEAAVSVDALDAFHGGEHSPSRAALAARRDIELPLGIGGSRAQAWTRWAASLPPHPHCMAHPAAHEFAFDIDPAGAFVRRWLQPGAGGEPCAGSAGAKAIWARVGLPPASSVLAGASIYDPAADAAALTAEGAVTLVRATDLLRVLSTDSSQEASLPGSLAAAPASSLLYPLAIVDAAAAREAVLAGVRMLLARAPPSRDLVVGAHGAKPPAATACVDVSEEPESPSALRAVFASARAEAGYSSAWGAVGTHLLLVEEDLCILERQRVAVVRGGTPSGPLPEGWKEIFYDEMRRLRLFMGDRADTHVRSAIGVAAMHRVSPSECYDAFVRLSKYKTWDFTWRGVRRVGRPLDSINDPYYFLADTPPPPYSYVITQRDFCMFRAVLIRPPGYAESSAGDAVFYRNGAHAGVPPVSSLIRGEALGVVGFTVQPVPLALSLRLQPLPGGPSLAPGPPPAESAITNSRDRPGVIVTLATAVDPKGSIPAFLVNFVAKRTPRMWVDRLSAGEGLFPSRAFVPGGVAWLCHGKEFERDALASFCTCV